MAGNYPDVPSNRMALDRDGTQMYRIDVANVVTELTSTQVRQVTNEKSKTTSDFQLTAQNAGMSYLVVFFSEKRDVAGYFFHLGFSKAVLNSAEVSLNSTNGIDGTWSAITMGAVGGDGGVFPGGTPVSPGYRTSIQSITALGIRALRFRCSSGAPTNGTYPTLHLYGRPSAGQNPNRLNFWHPTADTAMSGAYLDWGNTPRGSSADRTVRVKNMSATMTAEDITLAFDILTDATPSVPAQFLISTDGTTFEAMATIGDLAPGGISSVLTLRRNTPVDADLSVWAPRILAEAGSWT